MYMNSSKYPLSLLVFSCCVFALSGCERETPTERAGETIEEATEEAGGEVEEAGEAVEDATDR